ncbi:MAG: LD-carboxypeptidase [Flavobacteriaceae bacterium]|nr:LD-carboxypeptidase [Flavobacteriaceae bacterium]
MSPRFILKTICLIFFINFSITVFSQTNVVKPITRDLVKPPHLKRGDTIIILSPAGKVNNRTAVDQGIELANYWGLVVFFGNHMLSQNNTFAGTDQERLEDLQKALDNPSIKAIWCARGGYGSVRIVDDLDFTKFLDHPKWIIGYSDITVLHNKIHQLGYQTIHGQMPLTLDLENPVQRVSILSLRNTLFGKKLTYKLPSSKYNREGEGLGQLVGGNLSILYSMLGSDISLKMDHKILFIEDVGEALYHIDRMMISLKRAGYFEKCKGLIVGDFRLKKEEGDKFGKTLEEIILEAVEGTDFPVIFNFQAGHVDDNRALILGEYVNLKVTKKRSKISFR